MVVQTSGHLAGIHFLRGIAALMVFLFHLHYVGKVPIPRAWSAIATRGGMGVELFYVLSAFSLLYSNQKYVGQAASTWILRYLTKRFFRIAPLFYFMLAVHCCLILFLFGGSLDVKRIILSVLFIFNFSPKEAEGIVWASWSIGVEMVFYGVLPLIMVSVQSFRSATLLWLVAALASYVYRSLIEADAGIPAGYAHYAFMSQVGVFCGGVLGYWILDKMKSISEDRDRLLWWLGLTLGPLLIAFLLSGAGEPLVAPGRPDNQIWGLAFGLIAVLVTIKNRKWMAHPILQHFGERSYSIYLTHAVIIFIASPLIRRLYDFLYPALGGYGFAVCALGALIPTLVVSEVTYRTIEVRGIALGKHLFDRRMVANRGASI